MKTKSKPEASDLRERALRLLARREHSRFELAKKLGQAGFDDAEISAMLDEFEAKNWLSDLRFAQSWLADHRVRSGRVKLAHELRQRGVPEMIIETALGDERDSELDRAREVWRKKFGTAPLDMAERARHMRFLQSRGFATEVIRQVVSASDEV
jgi:regulatory protein